MKLFVITLWAWLTLPLYAQTLTSTMVGHKVDGACKNLIVEKKALNGHQSIAITEDPSQPFFALAPAGYNTNHQECLVTVKLAVPAEHVLGISNTNSLSSSIGYFGGIQYLYDNDSSFQYWVDWDLDDKWNIPFQGHTYSHVGPLFANYFGGDLIKQTPTQWTACKKTPQQVDLRIKILLETKSSEQNLAKLVFRNTHVRVRTQKCKIYDPLPGNPSKPNFMLIKNGIIYAPNHAKDIWTDHNDHDPGFKIVDDLRELEDVTIERLSDDLVKASFKGKPGIGHPRFATTTEQAEFDKFDPSKNLPFEPKKSGGKVTEKQLKRVIVRGWNPKEKKTMSCLPHYERERNKILRKLLLRPTVGGAGAAATGAAFGLGAEVVTTALAMDTVAKGIFLTAGGLVSSASIGAAVALAPVGIYAGVQLARLVSLNRSIKLIKSAYRNDQQAMEKLYKKLHKKDLKDDNEPLFVLSSAPTDQNDTCGCENERLVQPSLSVQGIDPTHRLKYGKRTKTFLSIQKATGTNKDRAQVLSTMLQTLDQSGALCDGSLSMSPRKLKKHVRKGKGHTRDLLASKRDLKKWFKKSLMSNARQMPTITQVRKSGHDTAMSIMNNMKAIAMDDNGDGTVDITLKRGHVIDLRDLQLNPTAMRGQPNKCK